MTTYGSFPQQIFEQFRDKQKVLTDLFAFAELGQVSASVNGGAEVASGLVVSGGYFSGLGIHPLLGRLISNQDDRPNAPSVVVVSNSYWEQKLGASTNVIGKQIKLNKGVFTIIGVTPRDFIGTTGVGKAPDLTISLAMEPLIRGNDTRLNQQSNWWLLLMGRMKSGVTQEQVKAQLDLTFQSSASENVTRRLNQTQSTPQQPQFSPQLVVTSGKRGNPFKRPQVEQSLYMIMVSVGLVLLIGCINIAGLLQARGAERHTEMAMRMSLGASRWRLMRQLLTEGLLLSIAAGAVGLFLAFLGRRLILFLLFPVDRISPFNTGLDSRLLIFTFAISTLTYLLFSIFPAWRTNRVNLAFALKSTGRNFSGYLRSRASKSLIIAQIAISLLLLVGACLFLRTLLNLQQVPLGFNPQNLLLFKLKPSLSGYEGEEIANLYKQIFERIEALSGVRSVTFSPYSLLSGAASYELIQRGGQSDNVDQWRGVQIQIVRANFFETMELSLQSGRTLTHMDDQHAPHAVVINQALARKIFPHSDPIGKRIRFDGDNPSEWEIVGMVRDAKYDRLREDSPATLYLPWLQILDRVNQMNFMARTSVEPTSIISSVRQAVHKVDGNLPLFDINTQVEQVSQSLANEKLLASLLSFFGVLALALASMGLYGVLAISVTQRAQEIGIRIALGAQIGNVLKVIIRQGMTLVLLGVVLGAVMVFALTRLLKTLLYGIDATDTLTFIIVMIVQISVALIASYIPARRATKINPLEVIRHE